MLKDHGFLSKKDVKKKVFQEDKDLLPRLIEGSKIEEKEFIFT
jgi:hypothetical protein